MKNKEQNYYASKCCKATITDNGICAACGKWAITYDTRFAMPSYRRFFEGIEPFTGKKIRKNKKN